MTVKDLEMLFAYGRWANDRLFDVLQRLSAEEFTKTIAGSYGSIRNTMVHMVSAEWGWVDRCGGAKRGPALVADDYPSLAVVRERMMEVDGHVRDLLSTLRDQDLDRVVRFALGSGSTHAMRLGHLLHHAANHSVHHRGQLAMLLRMLGHTPGNFDWLFFDSGQ